MLLVHIQISNYKQHRVLSLSNYVDEGFFLGTFTFFGEILTFFFSHHNYSQNVVVDFLQNRI